MARMDRFGVVLGLLGLLLVVSVALPAAAQSPQPVYDASLDWELEQLNSAVATLSAVVSTSTALQATAVAHGAAVRGVDGSGVADDHYLLEAQAGRAAVVYVLVGLLFVAVVVAMLSVVRVMLTWRG